MAKQHGLREQDAADARQEAVFWVIDAIGKYRFNGLFAARGYRLKAFLRVTIKRRMSNFIRGLRRKNRLTIAIGNTTNESNAALAHLGASLQPAHNHAAHDHTLQVADNDLVETARRRVATLGEQHETVFAALENGESLRSVSQRLDLSYKQTRRVKTQIEHAVRSVRKPR